MFHGIVQVKSQCLLLVEFVWLVVFCFCFFCLFDALFFCNKTTKKQQQLTRKKDVMIGMIGLEIHLKIMTNVLVKHVQKDYHVHYLQWVYLLVLVLLQQY